MRGGGRGSNRNSAVQCGQCVQRRKRRSGHGSGHSNGHSSYNGRSLAPNGRNMNRVRIRACPRQGFAGREQEGMEPEVMAPFFSPPVYSLEPLLVIILYSFF
jgi:hypothetical protein